MTREMEERIVAMYFDNEDFEKKAKTTIETLGQLQKGLDLKESAKGFEVFDKIGKTLNFDKAQKGLTKIKTTLTGMTGIFKKVFNLGPIDEAAAAVENFKNRYLNRVLGFDLARTVANSLESAFRGLTIQPISAGWTQYQNKMDSVKTIMSSTGESIETVETHLQSLTDYANKTIYSLTDMTSNLGKFTNNGMKLEDSVQAMKGIANAAADAGQGAQQASMAMYNFSQAMGVGKMTTIDWKSIENANMATTRLKNTFIEMAAAQGELHKEFSETDKKYHYYITKNSKGQVEKDQKKWTEVTAKNFRETLSKDWLTAEAMMHALMVYSGEALDPDTLKSWGITDPELIKSFEEIGQNALTAATQVRTFGKMMDALKEAAQSGWADTFELIFGNMEQGTTLWTGINEVLDGILSKSAEARNNMLRIWAGSTENTEEEEAELKSKTESLKALEEYLGKLEEETDIDKTTAKIEDLRASIQRYKDDIADLRKNQSKGNKESTQAQIDRRLKKIEELESSVKELEARNKKNVTAQKNQDTMNDLEERIRAYQAEIQTLRNADAIDSETNADASAKRQKQIAEKEKAMKKLQEQLDKLRQTTGTDEIEKTKKEIEALKKEIDELNGVIDEKNSKPKSEFVDEQGRSGRDILFDRETGALFRLIDLAQEFGKTFSDAFHSAFGFMDAEKLFNLTRDFGKAVEMVVEWFGKANEEGSRLNKIQKGLQGVFSILKTVVNFVKMGFNLFKRLVAPVADFAINAFEKVFGFFDGLGNLKPVEVFQKLGEGLQKTWEKVKKFFSPKDIVDKNGKVIGQGELPVITWLKTTWEGLKSTVRGWANDVGLGDVYNNVAQWWETFKSSINTAFEGIQTWWKGTGISEFFTNMWNNITGAFQPKANVVSGYRNGRLESWYEEAPIVSWLTGIWDGVKSVWNSITSWEGWSTIATFASNTWGWISSQFKSSGNVVSGYRNGRLESWYEEAPIVSWLTGIWEKVKTFWNETILGTAVPIWESIASFAGNTWGWIVSQFSSSGNIVSGYRNGRLESWYEEAPVVSWLSGIWESISSFWNNTILGIATPVWEAIASFASNTWSWIRDQFSVVAEDGTERTEPPIVTWLSGIWESIESFWNNTILGTAAPIWESIAQFAGNIWGWISSRFSSSGNIISGYRNGRLESWYEEAPIVSWLSDIWEGVKSVWNEIVGWKGWASIRTFLSNTWGWITSWFNGSSDSIGGASEEAAKTAQKVVEESNAANVSPEQTEESLNFFQRIMGAIGDFVSKVSEAMKGVVIPPEVLTFFDHLWEFTSGVLKVVGDVLGSFGKLFNGKAGTEEWNSNDFWNIFFSVIAGIGYLVIHLMSAKWTSKLSAVNNIGTQFLMFGGGMMLIASAISLLTTIDQEKMKEGAKVIGVLSVAIGAVLFAVGSLNQSINEVQTTGVERFFTNLINKASMLGGLYIITSALPGIIKALADAKAAGAGNIGEDVLKIAEGIGILFASVTLTMGILSKFTPGGIDPAAALKTSLSVAAVVAVMIGVFEVIGGLPNLIGQWTTGNQQEGVDAAIKFIQDGGRIMSALGIAIGEFFGSLIGAFGGGVSEGAMVTAANGVSRASEILSTVSAEQLDKFSIMLGFVTELQRSFGDSNLLDVLDRITTGGKLGTLGNELPKLGVGMVGFIEKIRDFTSEDMDKMRESMRFLSYFGNAVSLIADAVTGKLDFLGRVRIDRAVFQEYLEAAEQLSEAVKQGLMNEDGSMTGLEFNAMPIVEAICKALLGGKESIARAVKDMINAGLKQVDDGDYTSYNRLQVPEEVIDKYNEVIGQYKTENGEVFNINDMLTELMGDQGTFNKLMSQMDEKTKSLNEKWDGLTGIFNTADFMKVSTVNPETGEESNLDILSYFQEEMAKLEETINTTDPITVTITPVFDMTNMTPEKLQAALDQRFLNNPLLAQLSANNPSSQINLEDLKVQLGLDEIKNKLASLYEATVLAGSTNVIAINGLKTNVDGVANAVAGMRLVLDTGVLVGQITPMVDLALGQRSRIFGRTGVIFTKP